MKNKFNIGDRVTNSSNSIAPIQTGTVIVVMSGEFYRNGNQLADFSHEEVGWDSMFPNWEEGPVYIVELDTPTHPITKEKMAEFFPGIDLDIFPKLDFVVAPEAGLTIFEFLASDI